MKSIGKDIEKRNPVCCWWECKLVQPLWKTVWSFLKKLKIELPYDPAILHLGIYSKEMKTGYQWVICTPHVHYNKIFNSQDVKATFMSVKGWMDKDVVHVCNIIFNYEKEGNFVVWVSMDGTWRRYVTWNKSNWERLSWYHLYVESSLPTLESFC